MAPKILIVDDEPLVQLLYKNHLERAGYQLLTAVNGLEALDVAVRERPQLIFMDVIMEEMNGLAALRELKQNEATKAIPVVIITATVSSHYATRQESELSGAAGFLTKPLSPAQLISEIKRFLPPETHAPGP